MNKKEALVKIYTLPSPTKDLELDISSASMLIYEVLFLERKRVHEKEITFMDLNPLSCKAFFHFANRDYIKENRILLIDSNSVKSFKELYDSIKIKNVKIFDKKLLDINEFGNINLFIDFKKEYEETKHVWDKLKLNDILISSKQIEHATPIKRLKVDFINFKSKGTLYIYRKPFIEGGLISRYGI